MFRILRYPIIISLISSGYFLFISEYFKLLDNNVLKRKNVKIGLRNFGKVEILSGLEIGDNIVAEGTNKVRNKAKVKIKK